MKKIKLITTMLLAVLIVVSQSITAMASSIGSVATNPSAGEDTVQGAKTEYDEVGVGKHSTDVYLTIDNNNVLVGVPTTIIVNGTPNDKGKYIGEYSVSAKGDIAGNETVNISPKSAYVDFYQTGKEAQEGKITQEKIEFNSSEVSKGVTADGEVSAIGLSAGSWKASTSFDISINSNDIDYVTATSDMFSGSLNGGYYLISSYTGDEENLYIPTTMEYQGKSYPVKINGTLFKDNKTVKNVMFAENLPLFGSTSQLCYNASNLESIVIENNGHFANPEDWTNVNGLFMNCSNLTDYFDLSQFTTDSITFQNNFNLKYITSLPNAKKIGINCLNSNSSLQSIDCPIPASCTELNISSDTLHGTVKILSDNISVAKISSKSGTNYFSESTLTIQVPEGTTTANTILEMVASGRNTITVVNQDGAELSNVDRIYALGDSLTAGNYYISKLNSLVTGNHYAFNYGAESDLVDNLQNRIGCTSVTISKNFVIPPSTKKVAIELSDDYCSTKEKVGQDTAGVNCVTINGVLGFITYDSGQYYFNRAESGDAVHVCKGSQIITEFQASYNKGDKLVIYIGTNDFNLGIQNYNREHIQTFIDKIKAIVSYCDCDNYIVVGIAYRPESADGGCSTETSALYESMMQESFGDKFLNLREYFVENAYDITGLEADEQASSDLAKGIVPKDFFADQGTHWNTYGGEVVAHAIYDKLSELGMI